ncbi:hypothetical protein [Halospeciosus flavus]|uniref:Uncharacterized protein n=1 Tax=Halospeciosus flavus TaxID=3032283 RepID=A0ABD5Z6J1_9EURY|nr:hypothetical protein [Halospeciosus flavus]
MASRPTKVLLAIGLGTLLLVNPAFALPVDQTETYTYAAQEIDDAHDAETTLSFDARVLDCHQESRHCLFERGAMSNSTRVPAGDYPDTNPANYRFVRLDSEFYRPTARIENESYVLGLENVTGQTVLDSLARHDEQGLPDLAEHVLAEGRASTTIDWRREPLYDEPLLVESNGSYYVVQMVASETNEPITEAWWFRLCRGLLSCIGGGLVLYGYYLQNPS